MTPSAPSRGRRRRYESNAARQKAYRERKRLAVLEQRQRGRFYRADLVAAIEELQAALRQASVHDLEARAMLGLPAPDLIRALARRFSRT